MQLPNIPTDMDGVIRLAFDVLQAHQADHRSPEQKAVERHMGALQDELAYIAMARRQAAQMRRDHPISRILDGTGLGHDRFR